MNVTYEIYIMYPDGTCSKCRGSAIQEGENWKCSSCGTMLTNLDVTDYI